MRNPDQLAIFACSGIRDTTNVPTKLTLQVFVRGIHGRFVSGIHLQFGTCLKVCLRDLFITELAYEKITAKAGIFIYSNAEFKVKDLTLVSGIPEQISKHLLTKSVDATF